MNDDYGLDVVTDLDGYFDYDRNRWINPGDDDQ